MSRIKNYTRALISSYALVGANVVYTLVSVPIALKFLSKAEFGLWALTLQVANYIALIDLGMGSSIARILIDHKDDRANGRYGAAIKSGFLVGTVQGALILAVGLSIVWFMAGWLRVPDNLARSFLWLMIGQVFLSAAIFVSRMFPQILYAWQRVDQYNYAQILQLFVALAVLWLGFLAGWGVFSLLAGSACGWFLGLLMNAFSCWRLGFWPKGDEWGKTSKALFKELFSYGADLFLITIGSQLVFSSQTVLVSRQLGMEAAASWSVLSKAFSMASQLVWRILANAMPAFAEMQVRGEVQRLWTRYRSLFTVVSVLAGVASVLFAACNDSFVSVWTKGRFSWPPINNVLLGIWLIALTEQACHNGLVMCLKQVRGLKYVYIGEGLAFVGAAFFLLPIYGITGMLVCSLLATIFCTWLMGTWRIAQMFGRWRPLVWDWQLPLFKVLAVLVPCWLVIKRLTAGQTELARLTVNALALTAVATVMLIQMAAKQKSTFEFLERLPTFLQRPLVFLAVRLRGSGTGEG